jgi:hypothetical protein
MRKKGKNEMINQKALASYSRNIHCEAGIIGDVFEVIAFQLCVAFGSRVSATPPHTLIPLRVQKVNIGTLEQISAGLNRGIPKCLWVSESGGTDSVLGARSMPKPYSEDLRERVIEAIESGASRREAAENFRLRPSSAVKWWRRWHDTGSVKAKPSGGSKSPLEEHAEWLLALVARSRI